MTLTEIAEAESKRILRTCAGHGREKKTLHSPRPLRKKEAMRKPRIVFECDKRGIDSALRYLHEARADLRAVRAYKSAGAVARAIKSAEGAGRHLDRLLAAQRRQVS